MVRSMAKGGSLAGAGRAQKDWDLWLAGPSGPKLSMVIAFPSAYVKKTALGCPENFGFATD